MRRQVPITAVVPVAGLGMSGNDDTEASKVTDIFLPDFALSVDGGRYCVSSELCDFRNASSHPSKIFPRGSNGMAFHSVHD